MKNALKWFFVLVPAIFLFSCGGGSGTNSSAPASSPAFTIGGRVNGLSGAGLELNLNGGGRLSIEANGVFIFPESISNGGTYAVTVSAQPSSPTQHCITSNASGTASDDVTDIEITCFAMYPGGPKYLVAPVDSTASSTYEDWVPSAVFDYDTSDSLWNSGDFAPQWIILDLGSPRAVTDIHLSVVQDPDGMTSHQIYGGLTLDTLKLLVDLTGVTYNGQSFVVTIPGSALPLMQYLKIQTSTSPSWVAWSKIEVWANATNIPEYFGYYADAFTWLTSVTAEILEHVNISWVSSDLANVSSFLANLQYAQDHGLKVALATPQDIFFEEDLTLTSLYQDNWNSFASSVTPYLDSIAFIYPIDEPYSVAKVKGTSAADRMIIQKIRSFFWGFDIGLTFRANTRKLEEQSRVSKRADNYRFLKEVMAAVLVVWPSNGTIMGNCGYTRESAQERLAAGQADLAAFGRPFITNPDLPERLKNNFPLKPADDMSLWYTRELKNILITNPIGDCVFNVTPDKFSSALNASMRALRGRLDRQQPYFLFETHLNRGVPLSTPVREKCRHVLRSLSASC